MGNEMFKSFIGVGSFSVQKIHNEYYLSILYYAVIPHSLQRNKCFQAMETEEFKLNTPRLTLLCLMHQLAIPSSSSCAST
jgi:hypothetical protein